MSKNNSLNFTLVLALLFLYVAMNFFFIHYVGAYAWDDGAITLAYGQTIADHGKFALTGASEIVEGSSSMVLIFLSAVITKIFDPNFYSLILWSQLNTLLFTVITLFLTFKLLTPYFKNKNYAFLIAFLVGLFPMYSREIMNGMEMTMFSAFLLLLVLSYTRKSPWIYVLIPVLLLIRFESIFYLGFTFVGLFLFDKENRRYIFKLMLVLGLFFILFSLARYIYFGDYMPNTIWAKMHIPYSYPNLLGKIAKKLSGGIEFIYVFNIIFVGMFLFLLKKNKMMELKNISLWIILAFFAFSLIAGKNWGYNGRMFLAVLPIIVIFFVSQITSLKNIALTMSNQITSWSFNEKLKFYIIAIALLLSIGINTPLWLSNIKQASIGGYYQDKYLPNILFHKLDDKLIGAKFFGVTPENYKKTGAAVEKIRKILELDSIKFMVPDVGGLGMCCEKINVIDSALLTNKYLAKHGYEKFDILLQSEIPDVVETHGIWSKVTKIYNKKFFINNYVPIIVQDNFFWLNKKYIPMLIQNNKIEKISKEKIPKNLRYRGNKIDEDFIQAYHGDNYIVKLKNDNSSL